MEQIEAYKGKDGKIYFSKQECIEADKKYDACNSNVKFLHLVNKTLDDIVFDCQWHKIKPSIVKHDAICAEFNKLYCNEIFIKKRTKKDSLYFTLAVKNTPFDTPEYTVLINTKYAENQVGFCDDTMRKYLEPCIWAQKEKWIYALSRLALEQKEELRNQMQELATKMEAVRIASNHAEEAAEAIKKGKTYEV